MTAVKAQHSVLVSEGTVYELHAQILFSFLSWMESDFTFLTQAGG